MMWKTQQVMQEDAIQAASIQPALMNENEVFIWQNFQPAYGIPGWKNRDVRNRGSPPSHKNTAKIY